MPLLQNTQKHNQSEVEATIRRDEETSRRGFRDLTLFGTRDLLLYFFDVFHQLFSARLQERDKAASKGDIRLNKPQLWLRLILIYTCQSSVLEILGVLTTCMLLLCSNLEIVPWKEGNGTRTIQCIQVQRAPRSSEAETTGSWIAFKFDNSINKNISRNKDACF